MLFLISYLLYLNLQSGSALTTSFLNLCVTQGNALLANRESCYPENSSLSNDVRNASNYTSNYEEDQATGLLLTGMNRNVCDLKFTSVNVSVSVNMSALRFLSVYCCLFTSYIWWSLWMSQRHVHEMRSHIFIDGVKIKRRFTAKGKNADSHSLLTCNVIHEPKI